MITDMADVITEVERVLKAVQDDLGTPDDGDYWSRRKVVLDEARAELKDSVGARIGAELPAGCRVRIAGIATSCTAGMPGALQNWIAAAHRRTAEVA